MQKDAVTWEQPRRWSVLAMMSMMVLGSMAGGAQAGFAFEGKVQSAALKGSRMVRVWLPKSYAAEPKRRYPVLYVHDGQNAFSVVGTNVAFGWGNWELDKTVEHLAAAKRMQEIILVSVDAGSNRYGEYRGLSRKRGDLAPAESSGAFEDFSRFLREELKPRIDRDYRTMPDPKHTGLIGSSLGGISSLTLAWQHPEVFGLAASLSGAFQVEGRYLIRGVLKEYRGRRKSIRIYLDSGVVDFTGGDDGRRDTEAVALELRRIGWHDGKDLQYYLDDHPLTDEELARTDLRQDKWKEAKTSQHNEFYWRLRAWRALVFLFPPK